MCVAPRKPPDAQRSAMYACTNALHMHVCVCVCEAWLRSLVEKLGCLLFFEKLSLFV